VEVVVEVRVRRARRSARPASMLQLVLLVRGGISSTILATQHALSTITLMTQLPPAKAAFLRAQLAFHPQLAKPACPAT
jgi:hypothetical protein